MDKNKERDEARNFSRRTSNGFKQPGIQSFFGPLIGYEVMTDNTVNSLLQIFNDLPPDHPDEGDELAGQIEHQPRMPFEAVEIITKELGGFIHQFIQTQGLFKKSSVKTAWYVCQQAGEYNPVHLHDNESIASCIGYLAVPEDLEEIWRKSRETWQARTNDGVVQFLYGGMGTPERGSQIFWPQVGEFYIFPAFLMHTVYPFKCEGSRISFSMNIESPVHVPRKL